MKTKFLYDYKGCVNFFALFKCRQNKNSRFKKEKSDLHDNELIKYAKSNCFMPTYVYVGDSYETWQLSVSFFIFTWYDGWRKWCINVYTTPV